VCRSFGRSEEVFGAEEEASLISVVAALPFRPFQFHQYQGAREVVHFGTRWDYGGKRLEVAPPMPDALFPLREKAAAFAGRDPVAFEQVLVTRYRPGAPIGWHRDRPIYDEVIGVSLAASCRLRFRRARPGGGWDRADVFGLPRSTYLLTGDARWVWEHSIPAVAELRYSVTFRSLTQLSLE
jgi:alkylated DNA repair dioxygenase AlkB